MPDGESEQEAKQAADERRLGERRKAEWIRAIEVDRRSGAERRSRTQSVIGNRRKGSERRRGKRRSGEDRRE